jgi:nitroimidazol reductase NimA-like FMN-containing flavoprotein (pyridoxamine 5'-phosphate oxidase superfamily)
MSEVAVTDQTRIRLHPERGAYDRSVINAIIDEALVCHIGVAVDGKPRVIPTAFIRIDDHVYIHGSPNNQLLLALQAGAPACITATLVDSIVAARSGFGMSMDYRSVVIFAHAEKVTDFEEKERIVAAFVEDILPGHRVRPAKKKEIAATVFLRFPLSEASAKIRDQGVLDPEADHVLDGWAGVIPIKLTGGTPKNCRDLKAGIDIPDYAKGYTRSRDR